MQRRNFIKNILPMAAVPFLGNKMFANVLPPSKFSPEVLNTVLSGDINRVLVLIRLNGGNDGLATLVPMDQYDNLSNEKVRKSIMVAQNKLLQINGGMQAFHPSMQAMQGLFQEGKLTIIQGVANPSNTRSHFHGMEQWDSASTSTNTYYSGWLQRYIENNYKHSPFCYPDVAMQDPFAIEFNRSPSLVVGGTGFAQRMEPGMDGKLTELKELYNDDGLTQNMKNELAFLRTSQGYTNDYGKKIINAWEQGGASNINYPNTVLTAANAPIEPSHLGHQFKLIARMLRGGIKTRIFVTNIGGFDTHWGQGGEAGNHAALLKDLSDAIGAFQKDLDASNLSDRVIGMTYSEFGRRVQTNNSESTEHGHAAPMFIFGKNVSGQVIGANYQVDLHTINSGTNVDLQFDYRSVYKSILQDWFSISDTDSMGILKGSIASLPGIFKPNTQLPNVSTGPLVIPTKNCDTSTGSQGNCLITSVQEVSGDDHDLYARIQPNPSKGTFSVDPSYGFNFSKPINISVTDVSGRSIYNAKKTLSKGELIHINVPLPNGTYIVSIKNAGYHIVQKIVVQH